MQSHQTAASSMHAMHFALQCTVCASPSCALSVLHLVHQCTPTAGSKAEADTSWTRVCLKLTLTPRNPVQFFIKVAFSIFWVVALIFSDQLKSCGKIYLWTFYCSVDILLVLVWLWWSENEKKGTRSDGNLKLRTKSGKRSQAEN